LRLLRVVGHLSLKHVAAKVVFKSRSNAQRQTGAKELMTSNFLSGQGRPIRVGEGSDYVAQPVDFDWIVPRNIDESRRISTLPDPSRKLDFSEIVEGLREGAEDRRPPSYVSACSTQCTLPRLLIDRG